MLSEKYAEAERELIKVMNGEQSSSGFFDLKPDLTLDYIIDKELERFKNEVKTRAYARVMGYKIQMSNFTYSKSLNVSDIDLKWNQDLSTYLSKLGNNGSTVQKKNKDYSKDDREVY